MNKKALTVAVAGVLLLIGLVGGVVAFAQSEGPAPAAPDEAAVETAAPVAAQAGHGYGRGQGGPGLLAADQETMHAALAAALGLSVEELDMALAEGQTLVTLAQEQGVEIETVRAAMAEVRAAALEQAVADGLITAEEAEWFQNRAGGPANGGRQGGGPGMGPGPHTGDAPGLGLVDEAEMHAAIAEALGIGVAELEAAQAEGTPLVVLAQELGVDLPAVREAMAAVRETAVNQALADGLITDEQAEWLLSRPAFGERAGSGNQGSGPGMGRGSQSGRGQHGRPADELTGVGSGNGRGYGRMHTP